MAPVDPQLERPASVAGVDGDRHGRRLKDGLHLRGGQHGAASVAFRCAKPAPGGVQFPTGLNARVTWYERTECSTQTDNDDNKEAHRTIVLGAAGVCNKGECGCGGVGRRGVWRPRVEAARRTSTHSVPARATGSTVLLTTALYHSSPLLSFLCVLASPLARAVPDAQTSYQINCNTDNTGGELSFCNDFNCQNCPIASPFQNDDCNSNPSSTGSRSVRTTCNAGASNNQVNPQNGDVVIEWFESGSCAAGDANSHETIVLAPTDICHIVPSNGADDVSSTGYRVSCNADGSGGVFSTCTSTNCGTCNTNTPFTNGQCVPNPPSTGSASVRFQCMPPASGVAAITASGAAVFGAAVGMAQLF